MFIPLFTRPTKRGMCIIDWEEWLEVKKENLNFINCIYLYIIFCLLITLSIFSQRIHESMKKAWLKRPFSFIFCGTKKFSSIIKTREPLLSSMSTLSWWEKCHFSLGLFKYQAIMNLCIFKIRFWNVFIFLSRYQSKNHKSIC